MNRINVTKSSMPPFEDYIKEISDIWESHWLTNMGSKHQQLEEKLKNLLECDYVSLTVNGHSALEAGIQALNLTGEVITTPFTFASTTHAIVRSGLTPVFCDIDPDYYTIDTDKIERLITEKTSAILAVHVYGNICNIEGIEQIARKHNLRVIYDAAHTFGEKYKGKAVASYGDMSMLSFHATKVYNTIEGGAICYNDANLQDIISKLRDFGIRNEEDVDCVGFNAKMNEFQAAMGLCNLKYLDEEIKKRKNVVVKYKELLRNIPGIILSPDNPDVKNNYAYFPIRVEEKEYGYSRDDVFTWLKNHGIGARKYFYPLTSEFSCYRDIYFNNATPIAHDISMKILTLPLYADLALEDVEKICDIIIKKGKV